MAEVFKAKAFGVEGFERIVAVKRILPHISEDKEFIEMFVDEAKLAVQLNHANIAQIFDLGKVESSYFIAMEFVNGKDLRSMYDLARDTAEPMPIAQSCFIMMKVCEGMDYAHNKRDNTGHEMHLVHRDISPQNILISFDGEVKLIDFGIAKATGKDSKTMDGILKGKFGYMSPEQVRGLPLDRRSDIFSAGVVLYELLTGERLFFSESDFATLEKVRNAEILPPSTYNPKIDADLEQIVLKALAKDVDDRYQHAIDFHDDLQAYLYKSGTFYSRKDLAAWMHATFAKEIEEEDKKHEEYNQMALPTEGGGLVLSGGDLQSGPGASTRRLAAMEDRPLDKTSSKKAFPGETTEHLDSSELEPVDNDGEIEWEEDEADTQIYDRTDELPAAPSLETAANEVRFPGAESPAALLVQAKDSSRIVSIPVESDRGSVRRDALMRLVRYSVFFLFLGAMVGMGYYFGVYSLKHGSIVVEGALDEVELFLDDQKGRFVGEPPRATDLKPAYYIIVAKKSGYVPWERTVRVRPGAEVRLRPRLAPLALSTIELRTNPNGADVYLDGKKLGQTDMRIEHVMAGNHRLELQKSPDYFSHTHDVVLKPAEELKLKFNLVPLEISARVTSSPRGKVLLIPKGQDAIHKGETPVTIKIVPKGHYQLVVERNGYRRWTQALDFSGNFDGKTELLFDATLVSESAAMGSPNLGSLIAEKSGSQGDQLTTKNAPPGILHLNSTPWTNIFIDGRDTGLRTPKTDIVLPAGNHTIRLTNTQFQIDETFTVTIDPETPTKIIKQFSSR